MSNSLSNLAALPPEIRNRIYTFALRSEHTKHRLQHRVKLPPLLQTSRQVRTETLGLFFWVNDWSVRLVKRAFAPGFRLRMGPGVAFNIYKPPARVPFANTINEHTPLFRRFRIFGN